MSTQHAVAPRTRPRGPARPTSLPLRLVAPVRTQARRAPFVVVLLGLLGSGLVGLILLSTVLQAQAFTLSELNAETAALERRHQELEREVASLQAPAAVAQRAVSLGMVPNANPAFLRPGDGTVIGQPKPAKADSNVKRVDR